MLEHLEIISCLERGDRLAAADHMRRHLEQARRHKASADIFEPIAVATDPSLETV
ncbi:hypothetical protein D3C84_1234690 [compost metagenome]